MEYQRNTEELIDLMYRFRKTLRTDGAVDDLPQNEVTVLMVIAEYAASHEGQGIRMTELAEQMSVGKSTMTHLVNRLVKRGLAERTSAREDRRVVRARLTRRGGALYDEEQGKVMRFLAYLVERMGEEDVGQMIRLLKKYLYILGEYAQDYNFKECKHA